MTPEEHIRLLENTLTIDKYKSHFQYLSEEDLTEIETYISLSLQLFTKLKEDNFHKLENRYPNLKNAKNLKIYLDRDQRKIENVVNTGLADLLLLEKFKDKPDVVIRFKLFEYAILCESIMFLFEEIIREIEPGVTYLTIEKFMKTLANKTEYESFKPLFKQINKNLRNAIAHSDFEIKENVIIYCYWDFESRNYKSENVSIKDFQISLVKLSILFYILFEQIDKPFLEDIKKIYKDEGLILEGSLG